MSPERFVKGESERTLSFSLCSDTWSVNPNFRGLIAEM